MVAMANDWRILIDPNDFQRDYRGIEDQKLGTDLQNCSSMVLGLSKLVIQVGLAVRGCLHRQHGA